MGIYFRKAWLIFKSWGIESDLDFLDI